MVDDLDATVSPAALAFPAIDVVIRNQVVDFSVLGKEVGKALHGKSIICIVITPFPVCRIQVAGRRLAVFVKGELPLRSQELQDVVGVLYDSGDVLLCPLADGEAIVIGNEAL